MSCCRVQLRAFTPEEDETIIWVHAKVGNKWGTVSQLLSGRMGNAIKNYRNTTLKRKCFSMSEDSNNFKPETLQSLKRSSSVGSSSSSCFTAWAIRAENERFEMERSGGEELGCQLETGEE
ncbi:unnamed protein product [Fraxinus pennsylvanica]|uniref:Myb-like domain-containing protein n=1 Tax=Fraxinus pennsylvanica TaxID=56036 RepID=A0AAD1ZBA3_9LAMI|nr:unnamed protein product [Fraxinus pennsylvanica]